MLDEVFPFERRAINMDDDDDDDGGGVDADDDDATPLTD
jgi:hypothetical protein